MTQQWITMAEMAEHLGLSIGKFKEMLRSGAIPKDAYFQHGRTYRFSVDRVENGLLGSTPNEQLEFDFGTTEGTDE
jgi:excisionase family DNA binding protein